MPKRSAFQKLGLEKVNSIFINRIIVDFKWPYNNATKIEMF